MLVFIMEGKREFAERGAANAQTLSPDLLAAVEAVSRQAPQDLMRRREQIISAIEDCCKCLAECQLVRGCALCPRFSLLEDFAAKSRENGSVGAWFSGCDPAIRKVSSSVNGPALAAVAEAVSYEDMGAVDFFRLDCLLIVAWDCLASPSGLVLLCWGRCQLHAMGLALRRRQ